MLASVSRSELPSSFEAEKQLPEAKTATDWFDLLGSVQFTADKSSVGPNIRAEKGRPVATVLAADDKELELFFNSL